MSNKTKQIKPVAKAALSHSQFYVDEAHCFNGIEFTSGEMHSALEAYHRKKRDHSDWLYNDTIAIFVDANVLLSVYFSPVPHREHLSRFLHDNKSRVFITNQVEREFMRHRAEFIDKNKNNLTAAASKFRTKLKSFEFDFCSLFKELKNASLHAHFVDSLPQTDALIAEAEQLADNAHLLSEDFNAFQQKLTEIKSKFEEEYNKLYGKVNIEYRDPILTAISEANVLPPLSDAETDFIKNLYEQLRDRYDADRDQLADYLRFPGSGEKRDTAIKEEPWGDLLIYHQILAYMHDNHKDAIFLTNDKSKLDWMKKGGEPYSYYIADAYKHTGQTLFIVRAEDFLPNDYRSVAENRMDEDSVGDVNFVGGSVVPPDTGGVDIIRHYALRAVTEDKFMEEMVKYSRWADKFGEQYVSKAYFIYVVLGHQGYRYSDSQNMLQHLVEKNKIELYEKEKEGYTVPSMRAVSRLVETIE